jgi:peptide deformylase
MTIKIYSFDNEEENEILRNISEPVQKEEFNSPELKKIIDNLFNFTVEQPDGAGLSAPQIGINKRIFIINPKMFDYDKNGEIVEKNRSQEDSVFINPKIIKNSKETQEIEEGCFSVR